MKGCGKVKVNISRNTVTRWRDVDYRGSDTIACKDILCFGYDECENCLFETNVAKVVGLQKLGRIQDKQSNEDFDGGYVDLDGDIAP